MTFLWLAAWLMMGFPALHEWHMPLISLILCLLLDASRAVS